MKNEYEIGLLIFFIVLLLPLGYFLFQMPIFIAAIFFGSMFGMYKTKKYNLSKKERLVGSALVYGNIFNIALGIILFFVLIAIVLW